MVKLPNFKLSYKTQLKDLGRKISRRKNREVKWETDSQTIYARFHYDGTYR